MKSWSLKLVIPDYDDDDDDDNDYGFDYYYYSTVMKIRHVKHLFSSQAGIQRLDL